MVFKNCLGFTLVEISIALGIIMVLTFAGVRIYDEVKFTRDLSLLVNDANNIKQVQEAWFIDNRAWGNVPNVGDTDCNIDIGSRVNRFFNENVWEDVCFVNVAGNLRVHFDFFDRQENNERLVREFGRRINAELDVEGNILNVDGIRLLLTAEGIVPIEERLAEEAVDLGGDTEVERICFDNPGGEVVCFDGEDIGRWLAMRDLITNCGGINNIERVNEEMRCIGGDGIGDEIVENEAGSCVVTMWGSGCGSPGAVVPEWTSCSGFGGDPSARSATCVDGSWLF